MPNLKQVANRCNHLWVDQINKGDCIGPFYYQLVFSLIFYSVCAVRLGAVKTVVARRYFVVRKQFEFAYSVLVLNSDKVGEFGLLLLGIQNYVLHAQTKKLACEIYSNFKVQFNSFLADRVNLETLLYNATKHQLSFTGRAWLQRLLFVTNCETRNILKLAVVR